MRMLTLPESIGVTEIIAFAKMHGCEAVVLRDNQFAIVDARQPSNVETLRDETKQPKGLNRWFKRQKPTGVTS